MGTGQAGEVGKPSWCAEGSEVTSGADQKVSAQDRSHGGQTFDDPGLWVSAESAGQALVGVLDLPVQVEQFAGHLSDQHCGGGLAGQPNGLCRCGRDRLADHAVDTWAPRAIRVTAQPPVRHGVDRRRTGVRIDVLPGRGAGVLADWLCCHPGVEIVCRDGSSTYAQAVRDAAPAVVQVADRWHLWHGLAEAAAKEVAAHSACWAGATGVQDGPLARSTTERWHQVHGLLKQGLGLLECSRRLNLSLSTVKRYARASEPTRLQRVPKYRPTLVDPYRDHLRSRRAEQPGVPVTQLLREIRELDYPGSANLLTRYLNQGHAEDKQQHLSPQRAARLLLSSPEHLTDQQRERLNQLASACPEITALRGLVDAFAALLKPDQSNSARLREWMHSARSVDLPQVPSFVRGLHQDFDAVSAALTLPHHNGRTESVNTRTKMIKRQMYGRAGFSLLRHRILLG